MKFSNKKLKKDGTKYKIAVYSMMVIFIFFLSSRVLFHAPKESEDTPIGKQISIGNASVKIVDKEFYTDKNILEIDLILDQSNTKIPEDFGVEVVEKTKKKAKFKTELLKVTDKYYVILIHDLPKKWESVSIHFTSEGSNSSSSMMNTNLYTSKYESEIKDSYVEKNLVDYETKYINFMVTDAEKLIKETSESIRSLEKDIVKVENKIGELQADLEFQTEQEKEISNSEINSLFTQIESMEKEIEKKKEEITEQQNRIEMMNLKIESLKK